MNSVEYPVVLDGMLDESLFEEVAELLRTTSWKFGWHSANTPGESLMHWNKHIAGGGKDSRTSCEQELIDNEEIQCISQVWKSIKEKLLPEHSLVRCYANAHTFGLDGTIHRDNPPDVDMVTTIIYCHRVWPLPWGGETQFYDTSFDNIRSSVFPKPGRLVMFPGSVPHVAKSPSRVCRELRISLVFKSMVLDGDI